MGDYFRHLAHRITLVVGSWQVFLLALVLIGCWAASGPFFGFSDTWQLVINTGTTIITFLMVFLIQNTQNRDGAAIQAKLDELIRVSEGHNHFIGIEHLTETEVEEFRKRCENAAKQADHEQKAHDEGVAEGELKERVSQ